jgi:hypothetical protein
MILSLLASESSRFLGGCLASFPHGLLVAAAPESVDTHAGWDPSSTLVHAGSDSLYIGVQQAASGLVGVACIAGPCDSTIGIKLFEGHLFLSSARLCISEPTGVVSLTVSLDEANNAIEVFGDDADEPSEILIVVTSA